MPLADYRCDLCGMVKTDIYFRSVDGAQADPPICQGSRRLGLKGHPPTPMSWIPQARFDLRSDGEGGTRGRGEMQKFSVHRQVPTSDGLVQVEEQVSSLHQLRQIEKDSEQRYRDGEGEPLRFRAYAQSSSNLDQNAFGASGSIGSRAYDSGKTPQKSSKLSLTRHGEQKPKIPVARGAGKSPLT